MNGSLAENGFYGSMWASTPTDLRKSYAVGQGLVSCRNAHCTRHHFGSMWASPPTGLRKSYAVGQGLVSCRNAHCTRHHFGSMRASTPTDLQNQTQKNRGKTSVFFMFILLIPSVELSDVCADFFKLMLCFVVSASDKVRSAVLVLRNPL